MFIHHKTANLPDTDSKVTKAITLTLGAYLLLYSPSIIMSAVISFIKVPHQVIAAGILYVVFFMNNLVNPFIYYMTLKDFRQGYKSFLRCRKTDENRNRQLEMAAVGHNIFNINHE